MRAAVVLTLFALALGCTPPEDEVAGDVLFLPGEQVDLELRPLARIEDPTIVVRGGEPVLVSTGVFYAVENICNVNGCITVVVENPEPLCVSLRSPVATTDCVQPDLVSHVPVEEFPAELDTFVGRAEHLLEADGAMQVDGVEYFGVHVSGPLVEEHFLENEEAEFARFNLHVAGVRLDGEVTFDLAPGGVPLGDHLVGWEDEGAPGAGVILRDGALVELDQGAGILAGAAVGEAYFDNNGGRNVAFARLGDEVIAVRATPTDDFELGLRPPAPPVGLFIETQAANPGPSVPLRTFRAARATTPDPGSVQVCFNQRLDPDELDGLSLDVTPAAATGAPLLLDGDQCVFVPTEAQPIRAPLTITTSGATSARGDELLTSTVSAQSRPTIVTSAAARALGGEPGGNSQTHTLIPLSDGGVLVTLAGDAFEVGPDLRTRRPHDAGEAANTVAGFFALSPDSTGAWLRHPSGVLHYDADAAVLYDDPALLSIFALHALEGDRAIATDFSSARLLEGGTITVLTAPADLAIPLFEGPIHGTDELLWRDRDTPRHVRADHAGNILEELNLPGLVGNITFVAQSGDTLLAVQSFGVGVLTASTYERIVDHSLRAWSRLPDGALELYMVSTTGNPALFVARGAELTPVELDDPVSADHSLGHARVAGDRVFLRSFRPQNDFDFGRALRVTHRDHWDALVAGTSLEVEE
jgi:hypothetical protein